MARATGKFLKKESENKQEIHGANLLKLPPLTSPDDASTDPWNLNALLQQSYHLISMLRSSMGYWIITSEISRYRKINVIRKYEIPTVAIDMPGAIVFSRSRLLEYMELCAGFGMTAVEYVDGLADAVLTPEEVVKLAGEYNLAVHLRISSRKNDPGDKQSASRMTDRCKAWFEAGAAYVVLDPFRSRDNLLSPKSSNRLNKHLADAFAGQFGLRSLQFESPVIANQVALIDHLGPQVRLCAVRLDDVIRLEQYRRQPYSGFFGGRPADSYPSASLKDGNMSNGLDREFEIDLVENGKTRNSVRNKVKN